MGSCEGLPPVFLYDGGNRGSTKGAVAAGDDNGIYSTDPREEVVKTLEDGKAIMSPSLIPWFAERRGWCCVC